VKEQQSPFLLKRISDYDVMNIFFTLPPAKVQKFTVIFVLLIVVRLLLLLLLLCAATD
jgi:hypothetical protein